MILSAVAEPSEGVQHSQDDTTAYVEGNDHGTGTLYITESMLSWRKPEGQGFSLLYPKISLHAVSRDLNAFPQECLFLMVDGKLDNGDGRRNSESSEEEESGYDEPTTEVRFVPADKGALDAMYHAMSDCQALHPDEQDTDSEAEDFEANYYEGEQGVEHLTEQGQRTLQHLENLLINGQGDGQPNVTNIMLKFGHKLPLRELQIKFAFQLDWVTVTYFSAKNQQNGSTDDRFEDADEMEH